MRLVSRFHFEGSALAATFHGSPREFDLELSIDSDADPKDIATAIRVAHNSCYTEQALLRPVVIRYHHVLNGAPFEIPATE